MQYAIITNGQIERIDSFAAALPAHKLRPDLLPVEDVVPDLDAATQMLGGETLTIEADHVTRTWEVVASSVPATITASQARVALHRAGLLSEVTALVANPQTDPEIAIFWEYEVNLDRASPALNLMAGALGLTSQQLDDLFRTGSQIAV